MKFTPITSRILLTFTLVLATTLPTAAFAVDIGGTTGSLLAGFGATVFALVGTLFDKALSFLVFEIGGHMRTGIGVSVELVWSIVRDLCNLVFIFMFLFLGIRLVLTIENVATAQRIIARVIIAALLINFSLFASKAIIDVSNVATVAVYNMYGVAPNSGYSTSIGTKFAAQLGVASWFSAPTPETTKNIESKGFSVGLIMMFFFLLAAVTFLVATIMLLKRYIVLLLGMMFSPLVLLFSIIPKGIPFTASFSKKSEEGFQVFIQSAFFPAVFLFIIYIALQVLQSYTLVPNFNDMLADKSSSLPDIIVYCIGIGFLFVAMKSASMVSESLAANVQGATAGAAGWVGRKTAGNLAGRFLKSAAGERLKTATLNEFKGPNVRTALVSGFTGLAARAALRGTEVTRDGSYDVRNAPAALKEIRKKIGFDHKPGEGFGMEGGSYQQRKDAAVKKAFEDEKKEAERLKAGENDPYVKAAKEKKEAAKKEVEELEKAVDADEIALRDAVMAHRSNPTQETERAVETARKRLKATKEALTGAQKAQKKADNEYGVAEQWRVTKDPSQMAAIKTAEEAAAAAAKRTSEARAAHEELQGQKAIDAVGYGRDARLAQGREERQELFSQLTKAKNALADAERRGISSDVAAFRQDVEKLSRAFTKSMTKRDEIAESYKQGELRERERAVIAAAEAQKTVASELKTAREAKGGYAGTLEKSGVVRSALSGRTQYTQNEAGKKLRDAYKKAIPKDDKKDDKKEDKKEEKKDEKKADKH